jgi:hypothetical protein
VFLLIALGTTFGLLPRLPYATATTIATLLLVSGLLVVEAAAGVMALGDFSWETPAQLGHPPDQLSPEEAARVDLTSLGLTRKEITEPDWVNNVWTGHQAEAARAAYESEGNRAFLTVVRFEDPEQADQFFASWMGGVSEGVEIAHWEVNLPGLPGQGRLFRAYEPRAGKAYSAWQNEGWVTIIEVPGPVSRAMPLAREIKEAVANTY